MTRHSSSPLDSRVHLVDGSGRPLSTGRELARGGEGTVLEVPSHPEVVAKLYGGPASSAKAEKLRSMARNGSASLRKITAWPLDVLSDARSAEVLGFLMPRVLDSVEVHQLFSPAKRKRSYPELTFRMLVTVARNLAAAVDEVHGAGHVIGDINQKGFLVSPKTGRVTLIDCDSFQIRTATRIHRCEVGVAEFTPPELMGARFTEIDRAPSHDSFGLAVLIFQLLFMGRHPYAGRLLSGEDGTLERAIREHRFAYGSGAHARGISPAPGAFGLELVPEPVRSLFETCFSPRAQHLGRPAAGQWVRALDGFLGRIQRCSRDLRHEYFEELAACPWCSSEARGVVFFIRRFVAGGEVAITDIERRLNALRESLLDPMRHTPQLSAQASPARPAPPVVRQAHALSRTLAPGWIGWLLVVAFFVIAWGSGSFTTGFVWALAPVVIQLLARIPVALHRNHLLYQRAVVQQRLDALTSRVSFTAGFETLGPLVDRINSGLAQWRMTKQSGKAEADLASKKILEEMLAAHLISEANLAGFATARVSMLRSFGIETAADITSQSLAGVPGIGPKRSSQLLGWRRSIEQTCRTTLPREKVETATRQAEQKNSGELRRLEEALCQDMAAAEALSKQLRARLDPVFAEIRQERRELVATLVALREFE